MTHHWWINRDAERLKDYYKQLDLNPKELENLDPESIDGKVREAFRRLAREWHPDRNKTPGAEEVFKLINESNEVLSDPKQRAEYNDERNRVILGRQGSAQEARESAADSQQTGQQQDWQRQQHYQTRGQPRPGAGAGARQGTPHAHQQSYAGRSSGIFVNSVELPLSFEGASIFNNIAISRDGKLYAFVKDGRAFIEAMPEDGRLKVGGVNIRYDRRTGQVRFSKRGLLSYTSYSTSRGGNAVFEVEPITTDRQVDRSYEAVRNVEVRNFAQSLTFGLSHDGKVYVKGKAATGPDLKEDTLCIYGLEGLVGLPRQNEGLTIDAQLARSDVSGEVAHQGKIRTEHGDISLRLSTPLEVKVGTESGDISVTGMISKGRGLYGPPNAQPKGRLSLETLTGDIIVEYVGSGR